MQLDRFQVFKKSAAYQVLQDVHDGDLHEFKLNEKGGEFPLKFCATCRFYRPLRGVHGSRSSVCIQRYDHYCEWLGTDVGLHTHGWFLLMVVSLVLHFLLCAVMSLLALCASVSQTVFTFFPSRQRVFNSL